MDYISHGYKGFLCKKIGKYELGKTLGKGTFSKVKYGVDVETNQAYAIKIPKKGNRQATIGERAHGRTTQT